ncbi:MAG: D-tyrosyl-tRNA(Tyr) deacylase [Acidimicrobiia bacterium]|nr:D-tyrosyl-tRNA(Tyr) deacylase [Acidimicrobiia bacterium]
MRAVIQRVRSASVDVEGRTVGRIGDGVCVLLGVTHDDSVKTAETMAEKIWNLRIMPDDQGRIGRSIADAEGEVLLISQFTLYGDVSRGRRPSWVAAARPELAEPLVEAVGAALRALGAKVETGVFGADMQVSINNDGPVTLIVDV